ncbi:MAG: hypothetical protein M3463_12990 [Verrucomicrobiota bacterium]|nr:hypothetical protein [Verrucomicrobiota bacterium]
MNDVKTYTLKLDPESEVLLQQFLKEYNFLTAQEVMEICVRDVLRACQGDARFREALFKSVVARALGKLAERLKTAAAASRAGAN